LTQAGEAEAKQKQQKPIVDYLRLPDSPDGKPYIWGNRCKACGAAFLGPRIACGRCFAVRNFEEISFGNEGTLMTFTIVHQSAPGIEVPFIAAIVELPEGTAVRCNLGGIEPDPEKVVPLLGKKLELYTEKLREDREGNDVIAPRYRPAK
jgi:hypothetical protein